MKTIIERGASWTLEETKMLLALWGQDLVQRQATNLKRTKEVYERISEKFNQNGFERTADQVRTRVFNMIAEYRRILKDPNPERMRKCIFFEALHKIYQAKHMDDVKSALDDYEPEYPYSPASNTICSEKGESESISDSEATDGNETIDGACITNSQSTSTTSPSASTTTTATTTTTTATSSAGANNIATVTNNSGPQSCSTNETLTSNDNNGDSNNNTDKEQHQQSQGSSAASGATASKKIKLESPKSSGHASTSSTSATPSSSSEPHSSSKQNKSSSAAPSTPLIAATATASNYSSTTTASSSQRHQSLLLPHATATSSATGATTSTPISKLATSGANNTPSYININSTNLPIIRTNQLIGHSATNGNQESINGTKPRLPTTAAITSHQLYQAPVNTFDVTSSALLIDRMFAHLSRESENMREWITLEKERLALERTRRQQEVEREARRERVLVETLMRFQDQWLSFLSRLDPRMVQNAGESPPELRIPPKDATSTSSTSASSSQQIMETSTADAGK